LAKHTNPTPHPNFAKEPSTPSRSKAWTERHCSKNGESANEVQKRPVGNRVGG